MVTDKSNITAAILCGGKSTRMGREKSLRKLHGKAVFEHVLEKLKPVFKKIVISSNNKHCFSEYNLPVINDIVENCDALGGIYSVLKNVQSDYVFFIACDMPFAYEEVIRFIIQNSEGYDAVVPRIKGRFQPLFAIYSKKCLPLIEKNIIQKKLKIFDVIEKVHSKILDEKELKKICDIEKNFFNINTEEDFYNALNGNFRDASVVAFIAKHSNSGKTTLIKKIISNLKKSGFKVAAIKHTFHEIEFDTKGKDSYNFFHAGADAVVINSKNEIIIRKRTETQLPVKYIKDSYLKDTDIILTEGNKTGNLPKIELIKEGQKNFLFNNDKNIIAVVSNEKINSDLPIFKHDEHEKLTQFIIESFL